MILKCDGKNVISLKETYKEDWKIYDFKHT